jgi:hypothetical protein
MMVVRQMLANRVTVCGCERFFHHAFAQAIVILLKSRDAYFIND